MIELKIMFDPQTGQLQVGGPINDKILCYGLLERAKDMVRDFDATKAASSPIIIANRIANLNGGVK